MDDDQKQIQILKDAYAKAPEAVQEYLDSGVFEIFLERLRTEFKLPTAVAGAAGNEILMALLGITAAEELPVSLELDGKVPPEVADKLITALNDSIFVPLKQRMEVLKKEAPRAAASVPAAPPINRLAQPEAAKHTTPAQPSASALPVVRTVSTEITVAKSAPAPNVAPKPVEQPKPKVVVPPAPTVPEVPKPVSIPVPAPVVHTPASRAPVVPPTAEPVAKKRPGQEVQSPQAPKTPTVPKHDPYREPFE